MECCDGESICFGRGVGFRVGCLVGLRMFLRVGWRVGCIIRGRRMGVRVGILIVMARFWSWRLVDGAAATSAAASLVRWIDGNGGVLGSFAFAASRPRRTSGCEGAVFSRESFGATAMAVSVVVMVSAKYTMVATESLILGFKGVTVFRFRMGMVAD